MQLATSVFFSLKMALALNVVRLTIATKLTSGLV